MADAEARALGAGDTVEVNGKQYHVMPIRLRQLHELQREAVRYFKRVYIQSIADNLDLLPKRESQGLLAEQLKKIASWDVGDLPTKTAYSIDDVPINDKVVALLKSEYGNVPEEDSARRSLLSTALDSKAITPEQVKQASGRQPRVVRIPYDAWWVTSVYDGMIAFVLASLRRGDNRVTREELLDWPLAKLIEVARMVESLTAPNLGNMSASPT